MPVEEVAVGGVRLRLGRPADPESLLREEAFADESLLPYWAELWPSGRLLAEWVAKSPSVPGRRVLELGAGLGLPSLVAAARGAEVVANDWSAPAVRCLRANAARNGLALRVLRADWGQPEALLASTPFDLVLAADVLYERRAVRQLLTLVPKLLGNRAELWLADPGRPRTPEFLAALAARGFASRCVVRRREVSVLTLSARGAEPRA